MFLLVSGTGSTYDTEDKEDVTYDNTSVKAII